jgi:hypothetical protein
MLSAATAQNEDVGKGEPARETGPEIGFAGASERERVSIIKFTKAKLRNN